MQDNFLSQRGLEPTRDQNALGLH